MPSEKHLLKINNKDTKATSNDAVIMPLLLILNKFLHAGYDKKKATYNVSWLRLAYHGLKKWKLNEVYLETNDHSMSSNTLHLIDDLVVYYMITALSSKQIIIVPNNKLEKINFPCDHSDSAS